MDAVAVRFQMHYFSTHFVLELKFRGLHSHLLPRDGIFSRALSMYPHCASSLSHRERFAGSISGTEDSETDAGGILGEDMGTGKTLVCLALILQTKGTWSAVPNLSIENWDEDLSPRVAYYYPSTEGQRQPSQRGSGQLLQGPRVYTSCTTLIVVPKILINQWIEEINKHTGFGALRVQVCHTNRELQVLSLSDIIFADVLLLAQSSMQHEFQKARVWTSGGIRKSMDELSVSLLRKVRFRRIIVDEGHSMGRGNTAQTEFIQSLVAEMRWVCSGTPFPGTTLQRQLNHLHFILTFLRIHPYAQWPKIWNNTIQRPMLQRDEVGIDNLRALLRRCMVRTKVADIAKEICIPPLSVQEVLLSSKGALEAANYNKVVSLVRINLIASRGVDQDSLLDPLNSKELLKAVNNIGYACSTALEFAGYEAHREGAMDEIIELLGTGQTSDGQDLDSDDLEELDLLLQALSSCASPQQMQLEAQELAGDIAGQPAMQLLSLSTKIEYLMTRLRALVPEHKCIIFTRDNDALMRIGQA